MNNLENTGESPSIEDSPFYVKYTGKTKHKKGTKHGSYTYHVEEDFIKPLHKFLNGKFGDELSDNKIVEIIVKDYYFRYAHDRSSAGKTIYAVTSKSEFTSDNPTIKPLFIYNNYPKDNKWNIVIDKEITENYKPMQYLAFADPYENFSGDIKKLINSVFEEIADDLIFIQIPLNNDLDTKINGVYCYENNDADNTAVESKHMGVAIINDSFPVVYDWTLNEDFEIEIGTISKVGLFNLKDLCKRYNPNSLAIKLAEMFNSDGYLLEEIEKEELKEKSRHEKRMIELEKQRQLLQQDS